MSSAPLFESSGDARGPTLYESMHDFSVSARELQNFPPMMADPAEPKGDEIDPENLSRLLEIELIQKRVTWKQAGERYRSFRAAGFVFLFVLIVACLVGGYFAFMRVNEQHANPRPSSSVDR